MVPFVVALLILALGGYQLRLYYATPHDSGDDVVHVERGCLASHRSWRGVHPVTVVITDKELIFNDVMTFYAGYRNSRPHTYTIPLSAIVEVEEGEFRRTAISIRMNVRIHVKTAARESAYCICSRDPRTLIRLLAERDGPMIRRDRVGSS